MILSDIEKGYLKNNIDFDSISIKELENNNKLSYINLEDMYCAHEQSNFDLKSINNSKMNFAYDAMFGAGMNVKKINSKMQLFYIVKIKSFGGVIS